MTLKITLEGWRICDPIWLRIGIRYHIWYLTLSNPTSDFPPQTKLLKVSYLLETILFILIPSAFGTLCLSLPNTFLAKLTFDLFLQSLLNEIGNAH